MNEAFATKRVNAHRLLSLGAVMLALAGWGALSVRSAGWTEVEGELRTRLTQISRERDDLVAERQRQEAASVSLTELRAKLASVHDEVSVLTQSRDQARARLAAVQGELGSLTARLEEAKAKAAASDGAPAKPAPKTTKQSARATRSPG